MSEIAVCVARAPTLFPDAHVLWSAAGQSRALSDDNNAPVPADIAFQPLGTESASQSHFLVLAQDFLERSEALIDVVPPPPWEDEDDIFDGEVSDPDRTEYQKRSSANPSLDQKEEAARQLMENEAARYPGCTAGFLIALALTYRRILLDRLADPRDKVEILRRVYSQREPEWMTAEIVYLHFILLDQCRYLARASASVERKKEILTWIYTDPALEDQPFSFKNCVKLATGNTPDLGAIYRRLQEELRPALAEWLRESLARKRSGADRQSELFEM